MRLIHESDFKMILSFASEKFERKLEEIFQDAQHNHWDENYLTRSLITALGKSIKESNAIMEGPEFKKQSNMISFFAYKNTGAEETKYGDIA